MKNIIKYFPGKLIVSALLALLFNSKSEAQDIITRTNGDEIKAKVEEVLPGEVRYRKSENLTGPVYSLQKSEIFMIKYENGSKDVFGTTNVQQTSQVQTQTVPMSGPPAIIFFYRPSRFVGASAEIIVGTAVPDEVIVDLKNNHWFKKEYTNFGTVELLHGIYSLNDKRLKVDFEPGKTYYIRCSIKQGMGMESQLELVDEATGKKEMSGLKIQDRPK